MTIETDVVVIGAGPCGLFQVFELGLQGISCQVVEALEEPGGQCAALYPDKPIFDIPGIPECGAKELVDRLLEQIQPFHPQIHCGQEAAEIVSNEDGTFLLKTSAGMEFHCRAIIVAGGVGAFQPVRLKLDGIDAFEKRQLFYAVRDPDQHAGRDIVLLGGGDSALDWALNLAPRAKSLTLVHRSHNFRATKASVAQMEALCEQGTMRFLQGRVTNFTVDGDTLKAVEISDGKEVVGEIPVDHLLVFFGLSPKLGPIAEWGLNIERNQVQVDPARFQTNVPGIYAVGDINLYPGKKKLILSGFHEAALAAFAIKEQLNPGEKVHLMYTTTSTVLHERLGVKVEE